MAGSHSSLFANRCYDTSAAANIKLTHDIKQAPLEALRHFRVLDHAQLQRIAHEPRVQIGFNGPSHALQDHQIGTFRFLGQFRRYLDRKERTFDTSNPST